MHNALILLLPLLALIPTVVTQAQGVTCSLGKTCPPTAPCCSEFGFCGSGAHCLGGCNPLLSNTLDSCKPQPICQSKDLSFTDASRILPDAEKYDGDVAKYDWVVDKGNITISNGELAMILTETNGGTRISSTRYLHYGTVSAKLKTGRWPGVVTAFITMSSIKDEIDWEFPGAKVTEGQTNFFWQGVIPTPNRGATEKNITDTFRNYHEYTIDWKPDTLSFSIDGRVVRTIKASETLANGVNQYPSTPARVQLSIWPAGISGFGQGTVDWSGGMINWNDPDYKAAGQFAIYVSSVSIQCADPTPPGGTVTSYVYGANTSSLTPGISFSEALTTLTEAELHPTKDLGGSPGGNGNGLGAPPPAEQKKKLSTFRIALVAGLTVGFAVGGILLLIIAATVGRSCLRRMRARKNDGVGVKPELPTRSYHHPVLSPSANMSALSHQRPRRF